MTALPQPPPQTFLFVTKQHLSVVVLGSGGGRGAPSFLSRSLMDSFCSALGRRQDSTKQGTRVSLPSYPSVSVTSAQTLPEITKMSLAGRAWDTDLRLGGSCVCLGGFMRQLSLLLVSLQGCAVYHASLLFPREHTPAMF